MVACSDPLTLPLPRGVRTASNTNASVLPSRAPLVVRSGLVQPTRTETFVRERKLWHGAAIGRTARRSQAERSTATREALLDAAIDCLVEEGYASTTTSRVAERAGALARRAPAPLPDPRALVAAAMERLSLRRLDELPPPPRRSRPGPRASRAGSTCSGPATPARCSRPRSTSGRTRRTDEELRAHLIDVERDARPPDAGARAPAVPGPRGHAPSSSSSSRWRSRRSAGSRSLDTLHPGEQRNRKQWASCRERLAGLIDAAA